MEKERGHDQDELEPGVVTHWHQLIGGLEYSSKGFYDELTETLRALKIPGIAITREHFAEGSVLSARREYLKVRRGDLTYYVCAAPFGTSYFLSSWLIGNTGCLTALARIPLLGVPIRLLLRRRTFYSIDTALMFQESMHEVLMAQVDALTKAHNLRPLDEAQRKPILSKFYRR